MMRPIAKIIVHCTATPDALDIGVREINQWHLQKGWKSSAGVGCGYHFVVRRNGIVEVGRMVNEVGAHVEGENEDSVGIALVGTHEFNGSQIASLKRVVSGLQEMFPGAQVYGHREFPSAQKQGKTCPNFSVSNVLGG